jgi:iron(III) transport system ATP-binding protein
MRGGALSVENLVKSYVTEQAAPVRVVDGVHFQVQPGHFYALLGPSGCGKTTTLRCVAGLERADSGTISIGADVLCRDGQHVPPDQRDIGMVFQSYAIWPHMSVFENAAFPLRVARPRPGRAEIRKRVGEALELVRLSAYSSRSATQLSGGQQQRLALARALVREPSVLLLDEPLSNLDAKLRDEMRAEIRELQQRLGITALFVTHDQAEALSMSDRVAVMGDGRIVQEGTPAEIYQQPQTRYVADFVGKANFVEASLLERQGDAAVLSAMGQRLLAPCPAGVAPGEPVLLSIRPEELRTHAQRPDRPNVVEGTIERVEFLGDMLECLLRAGDQQLLIRQSPFSQAERGQRVYVEFPLEACTVLSETYGVASGRSCRGADRGGSEPAAGASAPDAAEPQAATDDAAEPQAPAVDPAG